MANYSNVQFISWELFTGPQEDPKAVTPYTGLKDTVSDIQARVEFTEQAIKSAYNKADASETTLKIFMAPEFLFRGVSGAYVHDFITGWENGTAQDAELNAPDSGKYAGLFGLLRAKVASENYKDWIFVFGTALSASWPTVKVPRLNPGEGQSNTQEVLDMSQAATIYNTALIQVGGTTGTSEPSPICYVSRKHYTSSIDFIASRGIPNNSVNDYLLENTSAKINFGEETSLIPAADLTGENEGAATFTLPNILDQNGTPILFGIEICLDHAVSSPPNTAVKSDGNGGYIPQANDYGRVKANSPQPVRIQLIPSGGMHLIAASIWLDTSVGKNAYAFNCDGLATGISTTPPTQLKYGYHSEIQDQNRQIKASHDGSQLSGTADIVAVPGTIPQTAATGAPALPAMDSTTLWNNGQGLSGAGEVVVFGALPL